MWKKPKKSLLFYGPAITSGVLVVASSPGANLPLFSSWLHWLTLVPLFRALMMNKDAKPFQIYRLVWVASAIIFGYSWSWFYSTLPLTWTGVNNFWHGLAAVSFFWIITVLFSATVFSLWSWFYSKLRNVLFPPLLFALAWTAFELIASISFSVFSSGEGSRIGQFHSFGSLGYHLHSTPWIINLASVGGVYLLTFLVVFINGLIAYYLPREIKGNIFKLSTYRKSVVIVLSSLMAAALLGFVAGSFTERSSSKQIRYAGIQTNYSANEKLDKAYLTRVNQEIYLGVKDLTSRHNPNIIILPEYSGFLNDIENVPPDVVKNYLSDLLSSPDRTLVLNNRSESNNGSLPQNITFSVNPSDGVVSGYAKGFLTPLGENIPSLVNPFLDLAIKNPNSLKHYRTFRRYQAGSNMVPLKTPFGLVAALPCSEIYTTSIARNLVKSDAEIIVVPANNAIFHGSPMLFAYNEAASRVRAVELNRYIIQIPNAGRAYTVTNKGKLEYKAKALEESLVYGKAPMISSKTFYTYTGNWIVWISLLTLGGLTIRQKRRRDK